MWSRRPQLKHLNQLNQRLKALLLATLAALAGHRRRATFPPHIPAPPADASLTKSRCCATGAAGRRTGSQWGNRAPAAETNASDASPLPGARGTRSNMRNDFEGLPVGAVYDRRRGVETRAYLLVHETEATVRAMGSLSSNPSPHLVASLDRLADALACWRSHSHCRYAEERAFASAYAVREAWRFELAPLPGDLCGVAP